MLVLVPSQVLATTRKVTVKLVPMGESHDETMVVLLTNAISMEHACKYSTDTYNSKWPDGSKAYGGYADYWRGKFSFVVKIPDEIPSDQAAPMLCGGITGKESLTVKDALLIICQHSTH